MNEQPTPGRRRVIKSADVRVAELLDAGLKVLCDVGYADASVSAITGVAGVAKGTFYLYFPTKAHLLVALRDRLRGQMATEVVERVSELGTGAWAAVDATIDVFVRFLVEDRPVHDALFDGPSRGVTAEGEIDEAELIAQLVTAGVDEGVFAADDPLLAAAMLFHGIHGAVDTALARGDADTQALQRFGRAYARRLLGPRSVD